VKRLRSWAALAELPDQQTEIELVSLVGEMASIPVFPSQEQF
jgi:hypothetical protein